MSCKCSPLLLSVVALLACSTQPPAETPFPRNVMEVQQAAVLPAPLPDPELLAHEHRIGPDDLLQIKIFEVADLSGAFRVSRLGDISMPLLGVIQVGGLTARELEQELQRQLRTSYMLDPHVSVQLTEIVSSPISVLGAVKSPGIFRVLGTRRLTEILALAGGPTAEAGDQVIVVRGDQTQASEVDLRAVLEASDARHDIPVHPGDVVKVVPAGMAYLVGEVNKPGAFAVVGAQRLTVLQAIALGAGLKPNAARNQILVIRTSKAGDRTTFRVDLRKLLSGKSADLTLEPKDVVFVPGNTTRSVGLGTVDALVKMVTLRAVF